MPCFGTLPLPGAGRDQEKIIKLLLLNIMLVHYRIKILSGLRPAAQVHVNL